MTTYTHIADVARRMDYSGGSTFKATDEQVAVVLGLKYTPEQLAGADAFLAGLDDAERDEFSEEFLTYTEEHVLSEDQANVAALADEMLNHLYDLDPKNLPDPAYAAEKVSRTPIPTLTVAEAFRLLATAEMRAMTPSEAGAWNGCQTPDPLIGYVDIDGSDGDYCWALVLDGEQLNVVHSGDFGGGQLFQLTSLI